MDRRIAIVGAGYISEAHIEALRHCRLRSVVAVVDADLDRAKAQATRWGAAQVFGNVQSLIEAGACDVAHVLVPPNLHRSVAEPLLRAGIHVFLEKPMAASAAECAQLLEAAAAGKAELGINQNFLFLPSYVRLKDNVSRNALGRLRHVLCHFNMPVRQISARQFGHWMFRLPQNILLEQAVHPLCMIVDLIGTVREVATSVAPALAIAPGVDFYPTWQVSLRGERADAQVLLSFGENLAEWRLAAICDDGSMHLDVAGDRMSVRTKTKWPPFADEFLNDSRAAAEGLAAATSKLVSYVLSTLKLRSRSDQFFRTMSGSVGAFHAGLAQGRPPVDGRFGAELVELCERIAGTRLVDPARIQTSPAANASPGTAAAPVDIAVLGGTGFIGSHVVAQLLAQGRTVRVMARNTRMLPAPFHDPRVQVVSGNITEKADVERAIAGASCVINLAHGGGGASWAEIQQTMVGSARNVAEACLRQKTPRLIYVSSIAALYLGNPSETITGATPPDAMPERRADYARGKVESERLLMDMARTRNLPLCILRPGVVTGAGGIPFHSGVGFYNIDRHCLGWNDGRNPLPFVLVEDVARAVVNATAAEGIVGKAFNLVGDVRLSAREYIAELAAVTHRPLVYHPQSVYKLQAIEVGKWLIKRAIGRSAPFPGMHDLLSRGMTARFDCMDAKTALAWNPTGDHADFVRRGIAIYGES
ncbi:MAG TPA: NAD-dependent epimerase/dehydratase family protein [Candidatus Cybelea sp.]|nr:NAD-dependent epimerase/dehydratase family protein [Candidatus Cybelea sp.]